MPVVLEDFPVWREPLRGLGARLRQQVATARGGWLTYALRHQAIVSARVTREGVEFRIARKHASEPSLTKRTMWERELETFVEHLELRQHTPRSEDRRMPDGYVLARRFVPNENARRAP